MFELNNNPVFFSDYRSRFTNPEVGGVVIFEGKVRNHNDGKDVDSLEYEVYEEMALSEGKKIMDKSLELFDIEEVFCVHRHGHLQVGDVAVLVIAFAKHRKEAFEACEYIINEVKHTVPVWKKEHYKSHPSEWVACHRCQNESKSEHDHSQNEHGA
jgi:molybdopterin synthase catalytic subunit